MVRPKARFLAWTIGACFLAFLVLDALFPFPIGLLHREPATIVADREAKPLAFFLPPDEKWRLPVRYRDLPPGLVRALISSEDRWFYFHPGVNPLAVARAALANLRAGRVVSGASTLPMQVARLVEPKERTLWAKVREAFRALQLEWHFSRPELIELYVNLAPYGGNLEGIGAASHFYFGKRPAQLSLGEIALLTALPRAPNRFDPTRNTDAAEAARRSVVLALRSRGSITEPEARDALRQPLPSEKRPPPFAAPHFARYVADNFTAAGDGRRIERVLRTTIDGRLQRIAEQVVERRVPDLRSAGIGNAAVVVIENHGRALRAMIGSADFFDTERQGQVNGALAPRSPGSTLKPFLYGVALDDGTLVPDSYVLDVPTDFSGYVAENFDGTYRGRVSVREALTQSLNSPAVRVLSQVGVDRFLKLLKTGGLTSLDRPASAYGLPLVLGAGEVRLLDLTNLYATLAEDGLHRPVEILEREDDRSTAPRGERLLSRETAFLVSEMLTGIERPDLPHAWDLTRADPEVAWKTGTSYGHRDAWAVGFTARYTIGVWVGNFDGAPSKGISGSRHAAPLFFDLVRAVESGGPAVALARDQDIIIGRMEVCALSHERAGPDCPERVWVDYLRGRSRLPMCTYHRRVFVDARTGELLSGNCLASHPHRAEILEIFPAELVAFWRGQGQSVSRVPSPSATCLGATPIGPPQVVSPDPSTPYRLRRDAPAEYQKIALVARADGSAEARPRSLFWYQDGRLVARSAPGVALFLPLVPGEHRLVVVDEAGQSDSVSYKVESGRSPAGG